MKVNLNWIYPCQTDVRMYEGFVKEENPNLERGSSHTVCACAFKNERFRIQVSNQMPSSEYLLHNAADFSPGGSC